MADQQGPDQQTKKGGPSPLSIVLFPLFPLRLMFRWMYQDPNIRGELLGAVIVASLVAISAVTGFIFGAAEDRRLDKELSIQTLAARYQTQLDTLKAFSDAIPKNITYMTRQKATQLTLETSNVVSGDPRSKDELRSQEQSLVQDWLSSVDHYTSVCRGVRASFSSSEVIDAVTNCELALDTLRIVGLNAELLTRRADTIKSLLDSASLPDDQKADVELAISNMREYAANSLKLTPPPVPGQSLPDSYNDEQKNQLYQQAWRFRAATSSLAAIAILTQHYYANTLDAMTTELRAYDETLRPEEE